ncbi:MAG TPA: hypothetical protein VLD13_12745 [Gaiellaceae bacterium]|nr:hypothetical protein [Gaiellaceae bacterium]
MLTQVLIVVGGLFPLAVMLVLLFAASWLRDERRERGADGRALPYVSR